MRRDELLLSFRKVTADLAASGIENVIEAASMRRSKNEGSSETINVLKIHHEWMSLYNQYGVNELEVFQKFDINELNDYGFWEEISKLLINGEITNEDQKNFVLHARHLQHRLINIDNIASPIVQLLVRKPEPVYDSENTSISPYLTVRLIEEEGDVTTAARVVQIVETIQTLYDAFQRLESKNGTVLSVAYLDSGSDKSFDFTGATSVINAIKGFLLDIYDRYSLHKKTKSENFIDVAKGSIEIFDKIDARVKEGKLPLEAAKVIELGLIEGMQSFLSVGAITTEIEQSKVESPRSIMKQDVKLLSSPLEAEKGSKSKLRARRKKAAAKKK